MKTLEKTSLFWDVDRAQLDPHMHAEFIIKRVLARGDLDDVRWIVSEYGIEEVKRVFIHARGLNRKSISFWQEYFHVANTPYAP